MTAIELALGSGLATSKTQAAPKTGKAATIDDVSLMSQQPSSDEASSQKMMQPF